MIAQEVTARRRANHTNRGHASVEHLDAASRNWIGHLGEDFALVMAATLPITSLATGPIQGDIREALIGLIADAEAWITAIDERPGVTVQVDALRRTGIRP